MRRELCLRVLVQRKWRGGRARRGMVPAVVPLRVRRADGTRVDCLVPTDVDRLDPRGGRLHAALNLTQGLRVRSAKGGRSLFGAPCCLVEDAQRPGRRLLLGCHHVFTLSLGAPHCKVLDDARVERAHDGAPLGVLADWASLGGPGKAGLDAALVELQPPVDEVRAWGRRPTRVAGPLEMPPAGSRILAPDQPGLGRHGPLPARFVSQQFEVTLSFSCGRSLKLRQALECLAETEPGDSGSPLVGPDGTLYGMHFYENEKGRSLCLPAHELFRKGVFGTTITLPP